MQKARVAGFSLSLLLGGFAVLTAQELDQLPAANLTASHPRSAVLTPHAHLNGQTHTRFGIPSIDSLVNFNDHYFASGFDSEGLQGHEWYTNTVGNPPQMHGTTTINAPV